MDGQHVLDEGERLGSRRIPTNGVELNVVEHGTGPLVVFCHGFPAIATLCAGLVGLLDAVGAERAVFAGHDWGAALVWQLALRHPERVAAVAGLSVPATPRAAAPPIAVLRRRLGDDFYMCWFQRPGVADAVLAADVRGALPRDDVRYAGDFAGAVTGRP